MMMKKFWLVFVAVALLMSCKKGKPVDPDIVPPPAVVSLSRNFIYPADNTSANSTYAGNSITGRAMIADDKSLVIAIETPFPAGNDNVTFVVPQAKLKAGYVGDYISQPTAVETAINYQCQLTATSANKFLSSSAVGTLKIASYNSALKTIAGQFSFTINAQSDPLSSAINNFKQTTIVVIGNFENLQIK